jgi:hypothetical protein
MSDSQLEFHPLLRFYRDYYHNPRAPRIVQSHPKAAGALAGHPKVDTKCVTTDYQK